MDDDETHLNKQKQKDNENERLWQEMKIDFHLDAFKFPDNKIYGIINIIPESSRKLIKNFVLVVNKTNRIEFDSHFTHVSASGFNTKRKDPSAYIEAIPHNTKWLKEIKTSNICYFFFTGDVFTLSPTISFDWSNNVKNPKAILVIKWYHIGDKLAQNYLLYLDGIEIQHIRQKLIEDAFDIRILGFEPGKKHTFQLVARLNNGKETYRSDLMEFIVPNKESIDDGTTEFITVLDEPTPHDLPAYVATKEDKAEEEFSPNKKEEEKNLNQNKTIEEKNVNQNKKTEEKDLTQIKTTEEKDLNQNKKTEEKNPNHNKNQLLEQIAKQQKMKKKKKKRKNKIYTCCDQAPHKTFPGIEHYLNNITNKFPSSDEGTDDDDSDIIIRPSN